MCGYTLESNIALDDKTTLASAFVPNFNACIALCSNINQFGQGILCDSAMYLVTGRFPANCWVSNSRSLKESPSSAVALYIGQVP
jgi:hypothetical protein